MYHQRYPSRYDEPFTDHVNVINPLQINGDSIDEYSIKVSVLNHRTNKTHVNVYSGKFVADLNERARGFQGTVMEAIEVIIQRTILLDFNIGPLPMIGRPTDYIFSPDDIVVSFASKNDYLVFSGTGASRSATFLTIGQLPQTYLPGAFAAPPDFTFVSSQDVNDTYKVVYTDTGNFTVLVRGTRLLTFDNATNPLLPVATYDTAVLAETVLVDNTKIYKTPFYTSVGITVLPNVLPLDQDDIVFAEGQLGLFYSEDPLAPATAQGLINYIHGLYAFNTAQQNFITKLIKVLFASVVRSIYHVLKIRNRDAFSVNNGFACFASVDCASLEIKLS